MSWTSFALRHLRFLIGLLLWPLLLIGCATVPAPSATDTARQAASRSYHENIVIGGRLALHYQQNGRDEAIHGSFNWVQNAKRTVVTLFSPLGQTIAIIEITPGLSTLTQAGQAPRTAENVDALVADTLGWPLPVSGLQDWLQGFSQDTDARRLPVSLPAEGSGISNHDGWQLQYPTWQEDAGEMRPRRIDMQRNTAKAGDVAIRIIIDSWQPG